MRAQKADQRSYPMIDDRTAARKHLHPHAGEFVWTQANNYFSANL
jgi:hypothetical protein